MRYIWSTLRGLLFKPAAGTKTSALSHVYETRCGVFDFDIFLHLNNASLILQTELARWNWMAQTGLIHHAVRNRWVFLVASQAVRYRHEVFALDKFQVKTTVAALDDNWIWLRHCVWSKNRLCAQTLVRVKIKSGKTGQTVLPLDFFRVAGETDLDMAALDPKSSSEIQQFLAWDNDVAVQMKQAAQ